MAEFPRTVELTRPRRISESGSALVFNRSVIKRRACLSPSETCESSGDVPIDKGASSCVMVEQFRPPRAQRWDELRLLSLSV